MPNLSLGLGLDKNKSLVTAAPSNVLWTPAEITTGAWYDASDASTITLQTGVSQWRDKSGNNRHLNQPTGGNQPSYNIAAQNGLNAVETVESVSWMQSDPLGFSVIQPVYIFCLYNTLVLDGVSRRLFNVSTVNNTADQLGLMYCSNNNTVGQQVNANFQPLNNQTVEVNEPLLYYSYHDNSTDTLGTMKNGDNLLTSSFVNTNKIPQRIFFNWQGSVPRGNTGAYYEMIMIFSILSLSDRQKMEGYLMHKWGLTGNLPLSHPYKNDPPYV